MIDFSLAKIALIGGVALVVIGPERLPVVARVAGRLFGRLQGAIKKLKAEVNQQLLTDSLHAEKKDFLEATETIRTVADDIADAEEDFSAAIATANQSFEVINQSGSLPTDEGTRGKQRVFHQKKQRHCAAPPVWYRRVSGKKVRFISSRSRRQSHSVSARFF